MNKLLKANITEQTLGTIGWLARYACRDFGKRQIGEILAKAGVQPKYTAKNAAGKMEGVFFLAQALEAIRHNTGWQSTANGRRWRNEGAADSADHPDGD